MKYQAIVFDMDGTILDTLEDLTDAVNYVFAEHGYPLRTIAEIRNFVGNGIRRLLELAVPQGIVESEIDAIFDEFMPYYSAHCNDKTAPYTGVIELIESLRRAGCKTAVVSNKADSAVQDLCDEIFPGLFDVAIGERADMQRKPAPDSVDKALELLGVDKANACYIGDSEVDVATARNAKLPCLSVLWGFRDETFLREHGGTLFFSTPSEVARYLLEEGE